MSAVRPAGAADVLALMRMGRAFLAASGLPLPWDETWTAMQIDAIRTAPDGLALVLGEPAVGFLIARAGNHVFAPVKIAQELAWWIDPPFRSAEAARALLDTYEAWARGQGCALVGLGMFAGADERLPSLYRRRGYAPIEAHYIRAP